MKIGLMLEKINTFTHTPGIYGDEIWANALVKGLNQIDGVYARTYGENMGYMPEVDVAIYFYFYTGKPKGKKNYFIFQNFTDNNNHVFNMDARLKWVERQKFNKVFTISRQFSKQYNWQLLYPAVDMEFFKPLPNNVKNMIDLAYIGNNIKDPAKSDIWLRIPGVVYGLFGRGFTESINHANSLRIFAYSTANLNFGFDTAKEIITARIFQIAACRGLIISEYLPAYKEIFGDSMFWVYPGKEQEQILKYLALAKDPKVKKEMTDKAYNIVKEQFESAKQGRVLYASLS